VSAAPPPPDAGLAELRELRDPGRGARGAAPAGADAVDVGGTPALAAALRAHLDTHLAPAVVGDLRITLDTTGYRSQPADVEEVLYRIAREALHNVVKHARARRVAVRLATEPGAVRLTVQDDGVGFAAESARRRASPHRGRSGLGLLSMRERAAQLGGAVRVTSAPGTGTCVVVEIPLPDSESPS